MPVAYAMHDFGRAFSGDWGLLALELVVIALIVWIVHTMRGGE